MISDFHALDRTGLDRRLKHLIWGRIAIAAVLIGATIVFQPGGRDETVFGQSSMRAMLAVTFTHLGIGFGFALFFFLRKVSRLALFTLIQIVWDLLFATSLVAITGGIDSIFSFLYWLTILNAAFLLFGTGAYSAAALSGIFYAALVRLQYSGWIPDFLNVVGNPPGWQESKVISSIVMNAGGFFLVAAVSSFIAATNRDTEAKLAEKSLEVEDLEALMVRIVESLTHGLVTLDARGRISYWNGMAEEITRLPAREARGKAFAEIFPETRDRIGRESLEGGEILSPWRSEIRYRRPDGTEKILGFSATGLRHGEESARGTLIMFEDLTAVRDLEERVKQADRLAAVGELAARMAHEIRNPLTSVSGAVEVLRGQGSTSEENRRLMNIVVRETDRLNQLLTDFLMYARPVPPQFEEVPLERVIRETVELFSRGIGEGRFPVSVSVDPGVAVWGDPKRLHQMIWNLLKNASESMESTGGEIRVTATDEPGEGSVTLGVADRGIGITPEVRQKMFQPFFTTKPRGNGLGLAVVHRIAEEHGGTVRVENGSSGGAVFLVRIPRRWPEVVYGGA